MKRIIKKIIGFFRPIYWPLVKIYFLILSPETRGVKIIITNRGDVLFVKNSYGIKYNFPGGNLAKLEEPVVGAKREVKEELGIDVNDLKFLGTIIPPIEFEYRKNTISIFKVEIPSRKININNFEIAEAKWLPISNPPSMGHVACQIFEFYKNHTSNTN